MIFWLDWMNNMNHSTCHWWFLWPEPSANGSGSTSRGFISAPRPANQQLKTSPRSASSPPDSVNPPKALLPVTAHRIQPPACSHSISLIRGNKTQMQFLPVSTLTHSGSISWLQVQTLLLFSHADCNYFTHKLLHSCPPPYPATVSFSFFLCHVFCFGGGCPFLLLVTLITPL